MKIFKMILVGLFVLALPGCGKNTDEAKTYDENRELVPNPEGYRKDTFVAAKPESIPAEKCNCPKNNWVSAEADTVFTLSNGKRIVLCGFRNADDKPLTFSEFVLAGCGQNEVIDFWSAVETCYVYVVNDTLRVETIEYLPLGTNRTYQRVVWYMEQLFFAGQDIKHTRKVNRAIPRYTQAQIDDTLNEYKQADHTLNDEKIELAGRLFMAAISGNETARIYFSECKTKFGKLDGAFAEEYADLKAMLAVWDKQE